MSLTHPSVAAEPLELRRLLSVTLSGRVVSVVATEGDDRIFIYVHPRNTNQLIVEVNGAYSPFVLRDVDIVHVDALGGNDHVEFIESRGPIWQRATVAGGAGNDTLTGAAAHDELLGQAGDDNIAGYGGNDRVEGNDGNDALFGNGGNDRIEGGEGNDTASGWTGRDTLI